jgi:hypothetical protein
MQADGRIAPALDIPSTVHAFIVDGMFWRRTVDPAFAQHVLPAVLALTETPHSESSPTPCG